MKLLAVDTATEACSAAILVDSEIRQKFVIAPRKHAELILSMVDELLSDAGISLTQLDALAFGRGPGAFTGIRIAAGITQGMAYSANIPVVPISNLAALAQSAADIDKDAIIFSAIDARMKEIYWCKYNTLADGTVTPTCDETVSSPDKATDTSTDSINYFGVGSGWKTYADVLSKTLNNHNIVGIDPEALPQSKDILTLAKRDFEQGKYVEADKAMPVYLRNKVAS